MLDVLTAPKDKEQWRLRAKEVLEAEELKECSFAPQTTEYVAPERESPDPHAERRREEKKRMRSPEVVTGDRCFDLYQVARHKQRKQGDRGAGVSKEEYEYEKNKEELRFRPDTSKKYPKVLRKEHRVNEGSINATVERMRKAREDRDLKKKMTERGENTQGPQQTASMSFGVDKNKFKSAFDKIREEKEKKGDYGRTGYRRPPTGTYTSLHGTKYGQNSSAMVRSGPYEAEGLGEEEEEEGEDELSGYPYRLEDKKAQLEDIAELAENERSPDTFHVQTHTEGSLVLSPEM